MDEFSTGLPIGYNTLVGENAGLILGRQAQWLQNAWALDVLILDKCVGPGEPNSSIRRHRPAMMLGGG